MIDKLQQIVEQTDTRPGRAFAWSVQILIAISLITFSISTLPNLSPTVVATLQIIETVTVILFTLEYVLRIVVADKKLGYIFSFYGAIDLLAILPFYLALGVDFRSVRMFRLLRMLRILKLVRYSRALSRFHRAFIIAKDELILFLFTTLFMLYLAAVGIYYFEHAVQPDQFESIFHSLWWAVATLTTVGYGDIYPITLGGRVFTFFVLMLGLGVVAVPTGLVASALSEARSKNTFD